MLDTTTRQRILAERQGEIAGAEYGYFELETVTATGSYSDADPAGRGITAAKSYQTIPGRVVWRGATRRVIVDGIYEYHRADVTITGIAPLYASVLESGRHLRVPKSSAVGDVLETCRVLETIVDPTSGSITIYAIHVKSQQQ